MSWRTLEDMETTATERPHFGTRFFDRVIAIVVGAMSSFWLDGALATEPSV